MGVLRYHEEGLPENPLVRQIFCKEQSQQIPSSPPDALGSFRPEATSACAWRNNQACCRRSPVLSLRALFAVERGRMPMRARKDETSV